MGLLLPLHASVANSSTQMPIRNESSGKPPVRHAARGQRLLRRYRGEGDELINMRRWSGRYLFNGLGVTLARSAEGGFSGNPFFNNLKSLPEIELQRIPAPMKV